MSGRDLFIYDVFWFNGYYNTSVEIVASSEENAVKEAKRLYEGTRQFKWGENPAINCGVYGEPKATLSQKNVNVIEEVVK